ncbi:unnamed protein product [Dovyalis caffra]|uniref:Uncharacterized protein n=1 Tax=Dovyalis caffra TaxID=77055 RepID=A0AAV1QPG5_9ROSI|nr:unnamed protein product [Dovyalis caffra]
MLKTAMHPTRNGSDHCAGSSIEKNDAMRIWLELKQNGFISPSSASMPRLKPKPKPAPLPTKKRERHINDGFSEKPELAKVRRVDGLAKVAASASGLLKKFNPGTTPSSAGMLPTPKKHSEKCMIAGPKGFLKVLEVEPSKMYSRISPPCGLLNEFNPGIINRIRSSKQVFSVIQALVRRDTIGNVDIPSRQENRFGENDANECPNRSDKKGLCSKAPSGNLCVKTEYEEEVGGLGIAVRRADNDDDKDEVKSSLSSITASENAASSVHSEASTSTAMGSSLSLEDANAASQWLQCLRHDITRRLEALMHSRSRIQNVIRTELPALMLKEFSVDQENELFAARRSVSMNVDVHKAKRGTQFDQMDKALTEEAGQLELWLKQVIEMQSRNDEVFCRLNQCTGRQHWAIQVDTTPGGSASDRYQYVQLWCLRLPKNEGLVKMLSFTYLHVHISDIQGCLFTS